VPIVAEVLTSYSTDVTAIEVQKSKKRFVIPKLSFATLRNVIPKGKPSLDSRRKYRKRNLLITGSALILVAVSAVGVKEFLHSKKNKNVASKTPSSSNPINKADFKPFVPKDNPNPDPNSVRFDEAKKLVSISDTFKSIKIVLSQQKLPEEQAKDPSILLKVTGNFKDAQPIQTDKGSAFLSVDTAKKTGQTAVFLNKNVLVFARTDSMALTKEDWQKYINNLAVAN
jgi:hypothetical protein